MSWVTLNVPKAPEPLACMRRSGMTSRSKWASFSRNHRSWSSIGPRGPAVMLSWLLVTGAPAAVVSGLVLSWGVVSDTACSFVDVSVGCATGTCAPVGHFGLVDDEPVVVGCRQARRVPHGAVHIGDVATLPPHDAVMVVPHAHLDPGRGNGRLDAD